MIFVKTRKIQHKLEYAHMNLRCGLRIKEGLDGVPQHPKSRTSIDDKHAIQALQ